MKDKLNNVLLISMILPLLEIYCLFQMINIFQTLPTPSNTIIDLLWAPQVGG